MGAHSKRKEPRTFHFPKGPWFFVVLTVAMLLFALGVGSYLIYDSLGSVSPHIIVPSKG